MTCDPRDLLQKLTHFDRDVLSLIFPIAAVDLFMTNGVEHWTPPTNWANTIHQKKMRN
jgi:hypothetical protein